MLSDIRCTVQNVVNVKLINYLHVNRHCKSINKELISSVGYGERLLHQWLIYQMMLRTDGHDGSLETDWIDCQPAPDEVFLNENVSQCK